MYQRKKKEKKKPCHRSDFVPVFASHPFRVRWDISSHRPRGLFSKNDKGGCKASQKMRQKKRRAFTESTEIILVHCPYGLATGWELDGNGWKGNNLAVLLLFSLVFFSFSQGPGVRCVCMCVYNWELLYHGPWPLIHLLWGRSGVLKWIIGHFLAWETAALKHRQHAN